MLEQPKPVLWLELDESAAGLPFPPEKWWLLCSSRIHYEQPMHAGKNPIFPLIAISADQVLVPRATLQTVLELAVERLQYQIKPSAADEAAVAEIRALLQR